MHKVSYWAALKTCGCGRAYDEEGWRALPLVGAHEDDWEVLEMRNCACGSTLAITLLVKTRSWDESAHRR